MCPEPNCKEKMAEAVILGCGVKCYVCPRSELVQVALEMGYIIFVNPNGASHK